MGWWLEALMAARLLLLGAPLFVMGGVLAYLAAGNDPELAVVGVMLLVAGLGLFVLGIALWPRRRGAEPSPVLGDSPEPGWRYDLVVLNDDAHTYDYVVSLLREVFEVSEARALAFARAIDRTGRAVVFTGTLDEATRKRDEILARGPDSRLARSVGPLVVEIVAAG